MASILARLAYAATPTGRLACHKDCRKSKPWADRKCKQHFSASTAGTQPPDNTRMPIWSTYPSVLFYCMLQACYASRFGLYCLSQCSTLKLREDVKAYYIWKRFHQAKAIEPQRMAWADTTEAPLV